MISSYTPYSDRVNGLGVEYRKIFRIDQLQSSLIQIHEKIFAVAPSSNDVEKIVSTEGEIDDTLVDRFAAPFWRQILLGDLRPA